MAGQIPRSRHPRVVAAVLAAAFVTTALAPLALAATGATVLTDPIGDNENGGGGASDIVALGATTNDTHVSFYIEVAGTDHPRLIQYKVAFDIGATHYDATTSYTTSGTFTSSFVNGRPITVTLEGLEVHMALARVDIGNPAHNTMLTGITVSTRHGASGSFFDTTGTGSYRVDNHVPVLAAIGAKSVAENATLAFAVTATDGDGDALTLSAAPLPTGASFSASGGSGSFSWTPDHFQAGTYHVVFTASDGQHTASENVTITVTNVNRPVVLDPIGAKSVAENALLSFTVTATDPDNEPLTFTAAPLPSGATFDATTHVFSWTPGFSQAGSYVVNFTVFDGYVSDDESVTITVTNTNRAPVIQPIGDRTVAENATLSFTVSASDPDGDAVTLSVTGLPTGATFDAASGAFSWTPNYLQAGSYLVTFKATDGSLSVNQTITITVTNTDRAPVLDPIGSKSVAENQTLTFTVTASDPDPDDVLTLSATNMPAGATFNATTGVFRWVPSFSQAGTYRVNFTVSDGVLRDWENITITVSNVNRAPIIEPISDKTIPENQTLEFQVNATDPDGDVVTLTATGLPTGATFTVNGARGTFRWTPTFTQAGTYHVTFRASDGAITVEKVVTITVLNVNRQPTLTAIGNRTVAENATLAFSLNANDPDGDALTFTAAPLPAGATLNATTGAFSWRPDFTQAGTYRVNFTASDGSLSDTKEATITVTNVNRPVRLNPIGPRSTDETVQLQFTVSATDPDPEGFTLSATGLPGGATFDGVTGIFVWTPNSTAVGSYRVRFVADDGYVTSAENVTITVREIAAPVLDPIGTQFVPKLALLAFTVTASDPDGDALTFSAANLPAGATFTASTGAFSWTPAANQVGSYVVTFSVSDGTLSDAEAVTIHVLEDNAPPTLDPIGRKQVAAGNLLQFTATASDPDGDLLEWTISGAPATATFNTATGAFSWTPTVSEINTYVVTIAVNDGDLVDSETFDLVATHRPNIALTAPASRNASGGEAIVLDFVVTNNALGADTVTFTVAAPAGWTATTSSPVTLAAGETRTIPVAVTTGHAVASGTITLSLTSYLGDAKQASTVVNLPRFLTLVMKESYGLSEQILGTATVKYQNGAPAPGSKVATVEQSAAMGVGLTAPRRDEFTTDASGVATIKLKRASLGANFAGPHHLTAAVVGANNAGDDAAADYMVLV